MVQQQIKGNTSFDGIESVLRFYTLLCLKGSYNQFRIFRRGNFELMSEALIMIHNDGVTLTEIDHL